MTSQKKSWQKVSWLPLVALIVLLGIGYILAMQQGWIEPGKSVFTTKSNQESTTTVTDEGVTWLGTPQEITIRETLFAPDWDPTYVEPGEGPRFYKLGTDHGNDVLVVVLPAIDPSGDRHIMLRHRGTTYQILLQHSPDVFYEGEYNGPEYKSNVEEDISTSYHSLTPPETLELPAGTLEQMSAFDRYFFDEYSEVTETEISTVTSYTTTPWGPLYHHTTEQQAEGGPITLHEFILKLANGAAVPYQTRPQFVADDDVPLLTWSNGEKNTDVYAWNSLGGCGAPGQVSVLNADQKKGLVPVGKTVQNEVVYGFRNPTQSALMIYYSMLPEGKYYSYNSETGESEEIPISIQEYADKHGVFVYPDSFDRHLIFVNQTYGTGAECGKPVIYLYPTEPTTVSVTVDADITKSEPLYENGWQVQAEPSGTLTTADGQQYQSLFWEGFGNGQYPALNAGFVVSQAELMTTVSDHLRRLGLNDREAQDFLDFWLDKLPTTPYVRLTWFGTRHMNELAPLHITPRPDTVIRIFLHFEGLQAPITIRPQQLSAIPRQGFTVIEWGGLLRK